MTTVRQAIARLKSLRAELTHPEAFYVLHYLEYRELARTVALQVLVNLRPVDADASLWETQAVAMAERVKVQLVDQEAVGLTISLAADKPAPDANSPANYQLRGLSISQIQRFVEAGVNKETAEEPGKNLDHRDDGKSPAQIAWRIMYAIRLGKEGADRLEGHIQDFLAAEQRGTAHELLPQILTAWLDVFPPRALADWRKWVHQVTAST